MYIYIYTLFSHILQTTNITIYVCKAAICKIEFYIFFDCWNYPKYWRVTKEAYAYLIGHWYKKQKKHWY